jgi:two-component system cell cycle sensor histidine kinase/response regulator CckA
MITSCLPYRLPHLRQCLINLIVNARDAMPDGGRSILQAANVSVRSETAQEHPGMLPGDYVMTAVRDAGVGMPEEVEKHLSEPFFKTEGLASGAGLGLAAVYGIIQQHRG